MGENTRKITERQGHRAVVEVEIVVSGLSTVVVAVEEGSLGVAVIGVPGRPA